MSCVDLFMQYLTWFSHLWPDYAVFGTVEAGAKTAGILWYLCTHWASSGFSTIVLHGGNIGQMLILCTTHFLPFACRVNFMWFLSSWLSQNPPFHVGLPYFACTNFFKSLKLLRTRRGNWCKHWWSKDLHVSRQSPWMYLDCDARIIFLFR